MSKYPDEIILGAPQICPECKHQNPSGLNLPKQCIWCNYESKRFEEQIKKIKSITREELFCKRTIS